jgi:tetratricopeptide (TPR) repeat protein
MLELQPEKFEPYLRQLLNGEDGADLDLKLDEIDDALQEAIAASEDARACAYLTAELLSTAGRPFSLAYSLNTAVAASCLAGETERVRKYLKQLVDITVESGTDDAALSAAENVRRLLPAKTKPDHAPNVLFEVVRLYRHLGKFEDAIKTLIVAAYLFADFGAFQPSYGSLQDAENLARENNLLQAYADVIAALHSICLLEGDHAYAETVWPTVMQKYVELGKPLPIYLAANRATALFRTGRHQEARAAFESTLVGLESQTELNDERSRLLINLSACLRELGEHELSDVRLAEARLLLSTIEDVDPEQVIEAELIGARNATGQRNFTEAVMCLRRAIHGLDAGLARVEKLHYRRGLRERYIPRIERLVVELPVSGPLEDVVYVISATRANRVSDWLCFLEWAEALAEKLSKEEKTQLEGLVESLASHGSPHLFGFKEKYDDPMSGIPMPDPWRDIAEYADQVSERHGVGRPFERATSDRIAQAVRERLAEGYAILVSMNSSGHKALLLSAERYVIGNLPEEEATTFLAALLRHREQPNQTKSLGQAVGVYQDALLKSLAPLLDALAVESCKGVIFIPDRWNLIPINLVMIGDDRVRRKMAAGEFDVRTCIALHPGKREPGVPEQSIGVIEGTSELEFDRAEIEAFMEGTATRGTLLVDPEWASFADAMRSTDALILSHHGASVGLFADPFFADMAGPFGNSAMTFRSLQSAAYLWRHRVVVLGTCHSGSLVNRSYQTRFKSHDLTGFPSVFLLNRRSEVVAASWAIFDRFNLLFMTLFAPRLREGHASQAVSFALAKLHELTADDLSDVVKRAFPGATQDAVGLLTQIDNLRRQPFCYGAYQTYCLL